MFPVPGVFIARLSQVAKDREMYSLSLSQVAKEQA